MDITLRLDGRRYVATAPALDACLRTYGRLPVELLRRRASEAYGGADSFEQVDSAGALLVILAAGRPDDPYLDPLAVADLLGITQASTYTYRSAAAEDGGLPEPDRTIGRTPLWRRETILEWKRSRPGRGGARRGA